MVCTGGKTGLHQNINILNGIHNMLKEYGHMMKPGSADKQKPAKEGTVEAWGRSENNPVDG